MRSCQLGPIHCVNCVIAVSKYGYLNIWQSFLFGCDLVTRVLNFFGEYLQRQIIDRKLPEKDLIFVFPLLRTFFHFQLRVVDILDHKVLAGHQLLEVVVPVGDLVFPAVTGQLDPEQRQHVYPLENLFLFFVAVFTFDFLHGESGVQLDNHSHLTVVIYAIKQYLCRLALRTLHLCQLLRVHLTIIRKRPFLSTSNRLHLRYGQSEFLKGLEGGNVAEISGERILLVKGLLSMHFTLVGIEDETVNPIPHVHIVPLFDTRSEIQLTEHFKRLLHLLALFAPLLVLHRLLILDGTYFGVFRGGLGVAPRNRL